MGEERDLSQEVGKYLREAHAMEEHSLKLVQAAAQVAGDPQLESLYRGHIKETEGHLQMLEERLEDYGESRSVGRDLAGRLAALGAGAGLVALDDTPARVVAVAYGFENFEIASYELLKRVAERAGDERTVEVCDTILVNERQAAEKLAASYDLALERALTGSVSG